MTLDPDFFVDFRAGLRRPPDPPGGRRLLDRLVLLPVGLTRTPALDTAQWTTAGLWLAVVAIGLYHGLNPAMGWPLAVSAGLMGRGRRDLFAALAPLAAGHLLAMLAILLPFTVMLSLIDWQREIRIGAGLLVIAFGVFRLLSRRHPRALARIPPTRLALWSFAMALAHGAALMLLPIYLGICAADDLDAAHRASPAPDRRHPRGGGVGLARPHRRHGRRRRGDGARRPRLARPRLHRPELASTSTASGRRA